MKADRLLSALLLLQAHGRLAERELAERLEVSQRTAHRDMEALCAAGIPLLAHRGAQGGWELEKGWRTRVPGLDDAELRALLMAQPGALGDKRLTAAAERAFDKLVASLSPAMRLQAEAMRARLYVDPMGWRPGSEDWSALPVVQEALARDAKLTFSYTKPDGSARTRTVDPLGLVNKQTAWYLVARTPEGMRTFRVSRMRGAVALALTFERPKRFDLARWWQQSTERLRATKERYAATLALAPEAVVSMEPWIALRAVDVGQKLPPGWKAYAMEFDSAYAARFVTLGLGSGARVLSPQELQREVRAEVRKMRFPPHATTASA
ncbi:MAG TPA: WYL domain-containing protein [Acidobacteriaceae bacterium]|jgi:predicted DNA-binding transcriptional regulator YafY|nr:WYL domain-containing protein [Acidobacteriaceae bacterium]